MPARRVTIEDVRQILVEVAGAPDPGDAAGGVDAELNELGYDSIAVLAAVAKVERDYGVKVDEGELLDATTLADLVELINAA
ncbi:acyl carrier protein [Saccharothrix sp. S26]|uniref:acyl carrier protein n=1 Tax=Saccharothrix sp. S26 TaxID=2907215 RepID=UPI001F2D5C05|nr:acyl carrier protein [Saccharothrix sp. S26]MCE6995354.1 acyl carrier protein [Saccharothrix sp. S26]